MRRNEDSKKIERRAFLRLASGAVALPSMLHGCGDDGSSVEAGAGDETGTSGGLGTGNTQSSGSETGDTSSTSSSSSSSSTSSSSTSETSSSSSSTSGSTGETSTSSTSSSTSSGTDASSTSTTSETTATGGDTSDADGGEDTSGETDGGEVCEGSVIAFDPESIAYDEQAYPIAVMSGGMLTTSVRISTFSAALGSVILRVWRPHEQPGMIALTRELEVSLTDGYANVLVEGLCAGTWYRYAFFTRDASGVLTQRSVIGEVRTAIDDEGLEAITIALSSCNGLQNAPWPALTTTAEAYYDVFLHLGDMAYNDSVSGTDGYRDNWKQYLATYAGGTELRGMAAAYARSGLYMTWDDHEVTDNYDPETINTDRLDIAYKAYFELMPLERLDDSYRLWRSYRWGKTVEFIVLDCRSERKPSTRQSSDPIYIGKEQMAWLKDRLKHSPCHFKVVLNSVPICNMPGIWDFFDEDRWEGYAAQRNEVLNYIEAEDIANVWFVSGDFHVCFAALLEPMASGRVAKMYEIAVTGGNTNGLGDSLTSSQFLFGSSLPHAALMTFDPINDEVNIRFVDPTTGDDAFNRTLSQSH